MAKTKRQSRRAASASVPATATETPARKRGRPRKSVAVAAAVPAVANGHAINGTAPRARLKMIEIPRAGPGRRRVVPADSIDGFAAQLANDIAAQLVDRLKEAAEKMVRIGLQDVLTKLHG
jgi:hypothetical protein